MVSARAWVELIASGVPKMVVPLDFSSGTIQRNGAENCGTALGLYGNPTERAPSLAESNGTEPYPI
jgi:hypothetical protein